MEGVHYELDNEAQFWGELDEILLPVGSSLSDLPVVPTVKTFVRFAASFRRMLPSKLRMDRLTSRSISVNG